MAQYIEAAERTISASGRPGYPLKTVKKWRNRCILRHNSMVRTASGEYIGSKSGSKALKGRFPNVLLRYAIILFGWLGSLLRFIGSKDKKEAIRTKYGKKISHIALVPSRKGDLVFKMEPKDHFKEIKGGNLFSTGSNSIVH